MCRFVTAYGDRIHTIPPNSLNITFKDELETQMVGDYSAKYFLVTFDFVAFFLLAISLPSLFSALLSLSLSLSILVLFFKRAFIQTILRWSSTEIQAKSD